MTEVIACHPEGDMNVDTRQSIRYVYMYYSAVLDLQEEAGDH